MQEDCIIFFWGEREQRVEGRVKKMPVTAERLAQMFGASHTADYCNWADISFQVFLRGMHVTTMETSKADNVGTLKSTTVEFPISDHPKCKDLVVAYEGRTARAKFLSQPRMGWYIYSNKNNESYFPLPITGSFIDTIISYSMWQFIYGSTLN